MRQNGHYRLLLPEILCKVCLLYTSLKTLVPLEGRAPLIIGISWDITNMQNIEQELVQARIKAEQSDRLKTCLLYTSLPG